MEEEHAGTPPRPTGRRAASTEGERSILRVGLTGNVAAGKSTVARTLAEHGCLVIDADALAHGCMAPGEPAHAEIVEAFGDVVGESGAIDRRRLGRIVFADADARRRLEAIVHPCVRRREARRVRRWADSIEAGIAVTEAALLFETRTTGRYHRIVVVTAPDEVRLERLLERGIDEEQARRRISSQLPQEAKARDADYVIDNGGALERTRARVERLAGSLEEDLAALRSGGPLPDRVS